MKRLALLCLLAYAAAAAAGGKGASGAKAGPVMGAAPAPAPSTGGGRHGGGGLAIGAAALTEGVAYSDPRPPPPMDPQRKVEEVDCTKPVDFTTGNLKCK